MCGLWPLSLGHISQYIRPADFSSYCANRESVYWTIALYDGPAVYTWMGNCLSAVGTAGTPSRNVTKH